MNNFLVGKFASFYSSNRSVSHEVECEVTQAGYKYIEKCFQEDKRV